MRRAWVVLGIALLVLGAALLVVPIVPQASHKVKVAADPGWYQFLENVSGFSITGAIAVSVSWTSSAVVDVDAAACSGYCDNVSQVAGFMQTQTTVTSGSFYLGQPNGGSIFLAWEKQWSPSASVNITFSIWTDLTIVGPILLTPGAIVLILGVVLRSKDDLLWDVIVPPDGSPPKKGPSF
jgi:hypothetical protein